MVLKTKKCEYITYKCLAITPIFATIILLGITAVLAGVMYSTFSEQIDPYLVSTNIVIKNLHAIEKDGRLSITATIQNSGQIGIDTVYIEDISVGDIQISQDAQGRIIAKENNNFRVFCYIDMCSGGVDFVGNRQGGTILNNDHVAQNDVKGFTLSDKLGISTIDSSVSVEGTKVFKLSLKNKFIGNIGIPNFESIKSSEKLTMSLRFVIGDDTMLSPVYTTRIKQG